MASTPLLSQNLAEFEPKIDQARKSVNDPSLTWYAYYSLANVNFLQQLVTKNALEARQRLNAANTEIVALKSEVASLKSVVTGLQASVEQLQAAQKAAGDKKPETKPPAK